MKWSNIKELVALEKHFDLLVEEQKERHISFKALFRTILYVLLAVFFVADTVYSFYQHSRMQLDGDITESVLPKDIVVPVFEDPLGIQTVINKEYHHNPNRFFSHWSLYHFFRTVPSVFQKITSPINSVYLTAALAKTLAQVCLIILISMVILGTTNIFSKNFIITAALLTPLFQTQGFVREMGIIDPAVSYVFFYAIPAVFLLLYLLPFLLQMYHRRKSQKGFIEKLVWMLLAIVVCFGGPLNPGIVLIVSLLALVANLKGSYQKIGSENWIPRMRRVIGSIPGYYYLYLLPICLLSLYSLYVGTFNSAKFWESIPLSEAYKRLPVGLWNIVTEQGGFILLGIILLFNGILLKVKFTDPEAKRILQAYKWVGIFAFLFLLLLPLGGYRVYRSYIIRYDTFMPISLCLFFLFGSSTFFILKHISSVKIKIMYSAVIGFVMFFYTKTDSVSSNYMDNGCERASLEQIAASKETVVRLDNTCSVVSWGPVENPENSKQTGQLLHIWNITSDEKLFYNKPFQD